MLSDRVKVLYIAGSGRSGSTVLDNILGQIYHGIHTASGCRVIVDSSKLPAYGHVVSHLPEVDLYVVHLVRDPRATAYSWLRKKAAPDRKEGMMQRQRPLHAAALWTVW